MMEGARGGVRTKNTLDPPLRLVVGVASSMVTSQKNVGSETAFGGIQNGGRHSLPPPRRLCFCRCLSFCLSVC